MTRRNRDNPARSHGTSWASGSADGDALATADLPPPRLSGQHADAHSDSLENTVRRGHRWLRFPTALEAEFQADTLAPRRKLLIICGLLGILSIYLGTANIAELNPDIAAMAVRVAHLNLMACGLGMMALLSIPKRLHRNWQAELVTALIAVGTCAGVINGCLFSRADTTFTHSAVMVSVVMYTCIAARQRFRWSLGCAALSFLGYVAFVKGFTPHQELIVLANTKLMALSFCFVLVANYTFEHSERRNWLLRKLEAQRRSELMETSERLHRLSTQDPLTGLSNRREFETELAQAWSMAASAKQPLAMLMVDVDFFKRYNDTYGHPAGDACLIKVSHELRKVAEVHGGTASRLGGEEFALLLPGRALDQAMQAGTDLCNGLRVAGIEHRASGVAAHVTVSVGAAQALPQHGEGCQSLMKLADQALYQAKNNGRDRTCAAPVQDSSTSAQGAAPLAGLVEDAAFRASAKALNAAQTIPTRLESRYAETLQGKFRWLRFPPTQEKDYRHHNADQRRKHLVVMAVLGLVIFNVYMLSSRAMYPDIQASVLMTQVGVSACLLALTAAIFKLKVLTIWWREAIFSLGIAATGVLTAWILSQSQHLSALSFAVSLALITTFSGVGARQPFWFTCVPAVITCGAAAVFLKPVGAMQTLVFNDTMLMIVNNSVFSLMLAYTLEYGARKEWLLSHIARLQRSELVAATQRLHELSTLDPLTGLRNRRQFEEDFQRLWGEARRDLSPLAMLIIDVDFFKLYNDGYGHPAGDRCLQQVAAALSQAALDAKGLAARVGGEEFCILLPSHSVDDAVRAGDCVCEVVRKAGIEHRYAKIADHVTVSVGIASLLPAEGIDRGELLAAADDALYEAKLAGRDRVAALKMPPAPRTLPPEQPSCVSP